MHMTSSVLVKSDLETAWAFLSNERNAARWDRSVARADLMSPPPLRVGSIVQTTAPSGMTQDFRVDEFSPPHVLRFSLVRSQWFRGAAFFHPGSRRRWSAHLPRDRRCASIPMSHSRSCACPHQQACPRCGSGLTETRD